MVNNLQKNAHVSMVNTYYRVEREKILLIDAIHPFGEEEYLPKKRTDVLKSYNHIIEISILNI